MAEDSLCARHAAEGARVLALRYLDEAAAAAPRLTNDEDLEALHDFRVGLRRLRSVLRAYRAELRDSIRGKERERIAAIASSTNDGRDAEVQLEWLSERGSEAPAKARAGVEWIIDRVTARMHAGYAAARSEMLGVFAKADEKLRDRLSYYDLRVRIGVAAAPPSFGERTAELLRAHVRELLAWRARVDGPMDQESIHSMRIAAKRLRYLVEPLRDEQSTAEPLVKRLKELQDILGDMHDMHVMGHTLAACIEVAAAERARKVHAIHSVGEVATARRIMGHDETDGLLWLTAAVRGDRDALYTKLEALDFAPLQAMTDALADTLSKRQDVEIERKYLLSKVPQQALAWPYEEIEQGYIPGDKLVERVRRVRDGDSEKFFRTMKMGHGVTRTEVEEETTAQIFKGLWALTRGHRVVKRRYRIPSPQGVWELDVFKRRKLALLEIELEHEDDDVTPPDWLADCIVREVTEEEEYLNANLAQ